MAHYGKPKPKRKPKKPKKKQFSYKDLEDAMKNPDSPHKTEYEKIRKQNLHKMEPIPVCKIPS